MIFADKTKSLIYDKGMMPLAKRTFEKHFWNSNRPDILALHMTGLNTGDKPGRNVANAGMDRTDDFSVQAGSIVKLNGRNSLFPQSFTWTVTAAPTGVSVVLDTKIPEAPTFKPTTAGLYTISLDTAGGTGSPLTKSSVDINVVAVKPNLLFQKDVLGWSVTNPTGYNPAAPLRTCSANSGCHRGGYNQGPDYKVVGVVTDATYVEIGRLIKDRVNLFSPLDSFVIRKIFIGGYPHSQNGSYYGPFNPVYVPASPDRPVKKDVNLLIRWIMEGAVNN